MNKDKQARLEKAGWAVADAPDFLDLSREQIELIDLKISLGETVRTQREATGLSQVELARRLSTSQPRLVKVEQGDASLDLLMRALFALNARTQAAKIIAGSTASARKCREPVAA